MFWLSTLFCRFNCSEFQIHQHSNFDNFFETFRDLLLFYFATKKTDPELISATKSDLAELFSQGLSGSRTLNTSGTVAIILQATILPLLENE